MTATHALRMTVSVLLTAFYSVKLVIHVKIQSKLQSGDQQLRGAWFYPPALFMQVLGGGGIGALKQHLTSICLLCTVGDITSPQRSTMV